MPTTTQWTNPRASGSSMMSASSAVPSGTPLHETGMGLSPPSQLCSDGIAPPASNAGLVNVNATAALLPGVGAVVVSAPPPHATTNDNTTAIETTLTNTG